MRASPLHVKSTYPIKFWWTTTLVVTVLTAYARADAEPFAESIPFLVNTSTPHPDTDADGMPDGYEFSVGLNPFLNDANADPDGDGLTNIQEYNAGTSPLASDLPELSQGVSAVFIVSTKTTNADTDGDGLSDDWEIANELNLFRNDANAFHHG